MYLYLNVFVLEYICTQMYLYLNVSCYEHCKVVRLHTTRNISVYLQQFTVLNIQMYTLVDPRKSVYHLAQRLMCIAVTLAKCQDCFQFNVCTEVMLKL